MAKTSPTQRTLKLLRSRGLRCGIVERYNAFTKQRYDLFGFIDIVALSEDMGFLGVQSCGQSFSAHLKKIVEEKSEDCRLWLKSGGKVLLIGWRKLKKKRGGKAMYWSPREKWITLEDLDG